MLCVLTSLNKLPSETLTFKPVGILGALEFKQYVIFYTTVCQSVRGDNTRALAPIQAAKNIGITMLC